MTNEGEVKLLDFGIAKIASPSESDSPGESLATVLPMMTPEYASPEQVGSGSITTAKRHLFTGRNPLQAALWTRAVPHQRCFASRYR